MIERGGLSLVPSRKKLVGGPKFEKIRVASQHIQTLPPPKFHIYLDEFVMTPTTI